jgi:hypothetical protein
MRTAYLLTTNKFSSRAQFSKKILETIGFTVQFFIAIPNNDKVLSNKISMMNIYNIIINENEDWGYVFEDDINVVEPILLDEIIQYEKISHPFFYLGCCMMNNGERLKSTGLAINSHPVTSIRGGVRGLHGIGISKEGAKELLHFASNSIERYMDCVLEQFSTRYPANIVRYDLMSPQENGHRGILFQDRHRFPSTI